MTATPTRRQQRPTCPLLAPRIVSLIDDTGGPYADSPPGWWNHYGGALNVASRVIYLSGPTYPPSPFHPENCANCILRRDSP